MKTLKASGVDCAALAALAVSDVAALNERLKAAHYSTSPYLAIGIDLGSWSSS